jgi:hypothetical protein
LTEGNSVGIHALQVGQISVPHDVEQLGHWHENRRPCPNVKSRRLSQSSPQVGQVNSAFTMPMPCSSFSAKTSEFSNRVLGLGDQRVELLLPGVELATGSSISDCKAQLVRNGLVIRPQGVQASLLRGKSSGRVQLLLRLRRTPNEYVPA